MMIWSEELAVVPVTIHVALRDVPRLLTHDLIVDTAVIVAQDLQKYFGILKPRLAVCGLNPHAGEQGHMGHEDEAVIRPAVLQLQMRGIDASGGRCQPTHFFTLLHAHALMWCLACIMTKF